MHRTVRTAAMPLVVMCMILAGLGCGLSESEVHADKGVDAVVLTGPALGDMSSESVKSIWQETFGWSVEEVDIRDLGEYDFTGVQMLYFPGADFYHVRLPENARANVRHAVASGMGYFGTCGGALVAARTTKIGKHIGLFPGHEPFGGGKVENRPFRIHLKHPVISGSRYRDQFDQEMMIHYAGGPADFQPGPDAVDGLVNWIVGRHGESGKPAITATLFGRGRVLLCSPHPERPVKYGHGAAHVHQLVRLAGEWGAGLNHPKPLPPEIKCTVPESMEAGAVGTFSAAGSGLEANYPVGYVWDFGDGSSEIYTPITKHRFTHAGSTIVTLTVTNGQGSTTIHRRVHVTGKQGDRPPVIKLLQPFEKTQIRRTCRIRVRSFDPDVGISNGEGIDTIDANLVREGKILADAPKDLLVNGWEFDTTKIHDGPVQLVIAVVSGKKVTRKSFSLAVKNQPDRTDEQIAAQYQILLQESSEEDPADRDKVRTYEEIHAKAILSVLGAIGGQSVHCDGDEWYVHSGPGLSGRWMVTQNGRLLGYSSTEGYLSRVRQHKDDFTWNVRLRCMSDEAGDVSVWFAGSRDRGDADGYFLAIGAKSAILQRKGKQVAASETGINTQKAQDITVSRKDGLITVTLKGLDKPLLIWSDPEPLRGKDHRTLGLYLWHGVLEAQSAN